VITEKTLEQGILEVEEEDEIEHYSKYKA